MNERLKKYLDAMFSSYEHSQAVAELKEELYVSLCEKYSDLKAQGYDEEAAYQITFQSIGDIEEMVESVSEKTEPQIQKAAKHLLSEIISYISQKARELRGPGDNISKMNLRNSDLWDIVAHNKNFNYSDLKGSNFSRSDVTNSSFKCADLQDVKFDGANLTRVTFKMANLTNTSFKDAILDHTDFSYTSLSGMCFDGQTFSGTIFNCTDLTKVSFKNATFKNISIKYADFSKAVFDGAQMDKLTYAVLKGAKADVSKVTII